MLLSGVSVAGVVVGIVVGVAAVDRIVGAVGMTVEVVDMTVVD